MRSLPWFVVILAFGSLLASTACAQVSDDERARAHFQAGESYFAQSRYADAAAQFDEAYRLSGRATLLANASVAFERAGNLELAIARLEAFLSSGTPEAEATRVTSTTRLEAMRARLAELTAQESEGAAEATAPTNEGDPSADPAAPDDTSSDTRSGMRIAGVTVGGVGVGLGVASLGLGLRSRAIHADLADVCGPDGDACPADRADDIDRGRLLQGLSIATMAGSIASLGAGATLFLLGRRGRADEPSASAFLDVAPGRFGITAFGSF